jgi:hypothetical protein
MPGFAFLFSWIAAVKRRRSDIAPSPTARLVKATERRGISMDNVMIIRVVAGALFVIVLVLLIQRRRTRVK